MKVRDTFLDSFDLTWSTLDKSRFLKRDCLLCKQLTLFSNSLFYAPSSTIAERENESKEEEIDRSIVLIKSYTAISFAKEERRAKAFRKAELVEKIGDGKLASTVTPFFFLKRNVKEIWRQRLQQQRVVLQQRL